MKPFKKDEQHNFVCEECGILCKTLAGLSSHIVHIHKINKEYFDMYLKDENDGRCKIDKKETNFISIGLGYKNCCCKDCTNKYGHMLRSIAISEHYGEGITNVFQLEYVKEICKQSHIKNSGYDNPSKDPKNKKKKEETSLINNGVKYIMQSKEGQKQYKKTMLEKTGFDHNFKVIKVKENRKETWIKNLGVDNPSKSPKIKKQKEETSLKNNGTKYPTQNTEIFHKAQVNAFKKHQYEKTDIWYQGSYELDFLNNYHDKFLDLQRGPSIKYKFKGKNKVYHSDFYIPSLNLIIECKNSYLLKRDKLIIKAKKKATIANGFNYIMLLDKNYNKLIKLLKNC